MPEEDDFDAGFDELDDELSGGESSEDEDDYEGGAHDAPPASDEDDEPAAAAQPRDEQGRFAAKGSTSVSLDAVRQKMTELNEGEPVADAAVEAMANKMAAKFEGYEDGTVPLADRMAEAMQETFAELKADLRKEILSEQEDALVNQTVEQELQALNEKHPDWREIADGEEFQSWMGGQASYVKKTWDETQSASDVDDILQRFHAEMGHANGEPVADAAEQRRQKRLASARPAPLTGQAASSGPPADAVDDDFDAGYEAMDREIAEANKRKRASDF